MPEELKDSKRPNQNQVFRNARKYKTTKEFRSKKSRRQKLTEAINDKYRKCALYPDEPE